MSAVKVVKIMGTSEESWQEAAHKALEEASESIDDIHGVNVKSWTADIEDGEVKEYRATTEIAFPVQR